MKYHMTSIFQRLLSTGDETIKICRGSKSYSFFRRECKNDITRTPDGDLLVRYESDALPIFERPFDTVIGYNSSTYSYFANEYRQNSPVRDIYGNIILSDDLVPRRHR